MHPGSPSDPCGTATAEAKPRCVYSIVKPHGQCFITSPVLVPSGCVRQHTQDVPAFTISVYFFMKQFLRYRHMIWSHMIYLLIRLIAVVGILELKLQFATGIVFHLCISSSIIGRRASRIGGCLRLKEVIMLTDWTQLQYLPMQFKSSFCLH